MSGGRSAGGAGGAANGGAGGPNGGQSAGNASGGADSEWPKWVDECRALRNFQCGDCTTPECLVCIYGTDEELQATGVSCDEDPRSYKRYCDCNASGCPPLCREEWR